jgi:hypothetical protein
MPPASTAACAANVGSISESAGPETVEYQFCSIFSRHVMGYAIDPYSFSPSGSDTTVKLRRSNWRSPTLPNDVGQGPRPSRSLRPQLMPGTTHDWRPIPRRTSTLPLECPQ